MAARLIDVPRFSIGLLAGLALLLGLDRSSAWAHGGTKPRGVAEPERPVALGAREVGALRITAEATRVRVLEIELRLERRVEPPDPILGPWVPVSEAAVTIGLLRDGTPAAPSIVAHPEGEAGRYGAHFAAPPPGQYLVRIGVQREGLPPTAADFAYLSSREIGATTMTGGHSMTHPFLAHMGLPDLPGDVSLRLTGLRRAGDLGAGNDAAVHVEAGVAPRLGLHVRNDAITLEGAGTLDEPAEDHGTEVMLMYAFLKDPEGTRGLAIFAELSWPTVEVEGADPVRGGAGLAGRFQWSDRLLLDADVHVASADGDLEVEYEGALQVRPAGRIFALLEHRGEISSEETTTYLLPAIKVGLGERGAFGVGVQFPLSDARQYERQTMFQLDWDF